MSSNAEHTMRLPPSERRASLVVLDTDVASFSLRNRQPNRLRAALAGHTMCITFVTVGELTKRRVLRSWGTSRTDELARWRQHVAFPPQNDTWLAACCLIDDLPLATLNIKDPTLTRLVRTPAGVIDLG